MHSGAVMGEGKRARSVLLVALLTIQSIERFFWMHWFLGLQGRTTLGAGLLLFVTYMLPIALAPMVDRIGSGRGVLAGTLLYAFGFLTATATPALGIWLVVAASAVHKTAVGPTLSDVGDNRAYPLLYLAANVASGASAFAYGWLDRTVGISGMDGIACASFVVASVLALSLRHIAGVKNSSTSTGSFSKVVSLGLCQLPIYVCNWKFQTDYRVSITPLFATAGMPQGSLWGTVCLVVTLCSYGLGMERCTGLLKDGRGVLFRGAILFVGYYALAGLTAEHSSHFPAAYPFVILAESVLFAMADSLVGAVSQRLMVEAAPTKALGAAGYFCAVGAGALLAYLIGSTARPLLFVLAGIGLLTPVLMIILLRRSKPIP